MTATHVENEIIWSLSPALKHTRERIYSGREETIVVTVTIYIPSHRRVPSPWSFAGTAAQSRTA